MLRTPYLALRRRARAVATLATIAVSLLSSAARADGEEAPPELPPADVDAPVATPAQAASVPPQRRVGMIGRVHGGLGERRLYGNSVLGADLTGSLGAYSDNLNVYFDAQLLLASSEGLPVRQYRLGPSVDFEPFSHLRLGVGASAGGTTIARTSGGTMYAFSLGARVFASVDLWKIGERGGVYILGQLSVDSAGTLFETKYRGSVPTAVLWGPTVAMGVRF